MTSRRRVIVVVGPTACGKSAVAAELAFVLGTEVVNADALQLYRELMVGVAKPDARLLHMVPHHLFDVASVREPWSVGRYVVTSREVVESIWRRHDAAVVAGGTGMYVKGLLEGIDEVPPVPADVKRRVRLLVARHGSSRAHRLLRRVDPALASRLAPADGQRIGRGLEVAFGTGSRLSDHQRGRGIPLPASTCLVVGLRRTIPDLAARIRERVDGMWLMGLLEEARGLVAEGLRPLVEARKPIGYREAFAVLDGSLSEEEAKDETVRATLAFAKRQLTWWRHRSVTWIDVPAGREPSAAEVLQRVTWSPKAVRESGEGERHAPIATDPTKEHA